MKTIRCTWKGTTPLIMHSCEGVNPLHPLSQKMKALTAKRKKTEEDLRAISDLEWELSLYWDDQLGVVLPADNIEGAIKDGAKARKRGKDIEKAVSVTEIVVPVNYGENLTLDQLRADYGHRDVRSMRVMNSRVMRTRARFNRWAVTFDICYDEQIIDLPSLVDALEYAGQYVGVGDSRQRKYGRFVCTVEELD